MHIITKEFIYKTILNYFSCSIKYSLKILNSKDSSFNLIIQRRKNMYTDLSVELLEFCYRLSLMNFIIMIRNYIKRGGENYKDYSEDIIQELGPASKSDISISS